MSSCTGTRYLKNQTTRGARVKNTGGHLAASWKALAAGVMRARVLVVTKTVSLQGASACPMFPAAPWWRRCFAGQSAGVSTKNESGHVANLFAAWLAKSALWPAS